MSKNAVTHYLYLTASDSKKHLTSLQNVTHCYMTLTMQLLTMIKKRCSQGTFYIMISPAFFSRLYMQDCTLTFKCAKYSNQQFSNN